MNKKVLSAILFSALFAGTGTFTSCIDNDEPAGIEELRGAKAELIRAKVAVEQAEAARLMAVAEFHKAEAAREQAVAAIREAEAKIKEAEAEMQNIKNDEARADLENKIANYEIELQKAQKDLELALIQKETQIVEAQRAHEVALKQIAIAKALGSDSEKVTLAALEKEVEDLYNDLYAEGKLAGQIRDAEKKLYNATLDKAQGVDSESKSDIWIPTLELKVVEAEAGVAGAKEEVAKLEAFIEKDVETTDWRAEIVALGDSAELLKNLISEKDIEINKALNSEAWLAADQKLNGVKNDKNIVVKNGAVQDLDDAIEAYDEYAEGGEEALDLTLSEIKVAPVAELSDEITAAVNAYNAKNKSVLKTWNGSAFQIAEQEYQQPVFGTKLDAAHGYVPAVTLQQVNAWIGALDMAIVSANDSELAKLTLEAQKEAVAEADTANMEAVELWQVALKAANGTATAVPTKGVNDAITAYNAKADALTAAVTAYNTAYETIYTTAYEANYKESENEVYWNEFKARAYSDLSNPNVKPISGGVANKINGIEGYYDNYTAKIADLENYYVVDPAIVDDPATTTVNEATEAAKAVADLLATTKKYANKAVDGVSVAQEEAWANAAKAKGDDAITAAKATGKELANKQKAIDDAAKAAKEANDKMVKAYADYTTLAADTYAQVPTADAKKVSFPGASKIEWKDDKYVLTIAKMSAENTTKKLALELDESKAQTALLNTSNAAYGMNEKRAVAPTEAEIRAYAKDKGVALATCGTYGAYLAQQDKLASLNNDIAAADKLAEVKTAAAAAKKALEAEIAANEANFAELNKAIETAEAAVEVAEEELAKIEVELVGELNVEKAKLQAKGAAVESVIKTLVGAVNAHLHDVDVTFKDAEQFVEALETALLEAKKNVATAEKGLAAAEVALQKAKEGKYDAVAEAQFELDMLNAKFEKAMAAYEKALANLELAIEIMIAE